MPNTLKILPKRGEISPNLFAFKSFRNYLIVLLHSRVVIMVEHSCPYLPKKDFLQRF